MERAKGRNRTGVPAGLIAAAAATAAMLLGGQLTGLPSFPETLAEGIASVTPIGVIEALTGMLGGGAKRGLFGAVLAGHLAVGGGLGCWIARRRLSRTQTLAVIVMAATATALLGLPALGGGVLGASTRAGAAGTVASLAVGSGAFLLCYRWIMQYLNPIGLFAAEDAASRRDFLRKAGLTLCIAVTGIGGFRWVAAHLTPQLGSNEPSAETRTTFAAIAAAPSVAEALAAGIPGLSPEVTPNDRFYVVSKNVVRDPDVSPSNWRLDIAGAVDRPFSLTYDQLKALPVANQYLTLQCISNPVGGNLIGNAGWRGVPLASLLRQAGVRPGAVDVILRAADDYSDSIPIAKAMDTGTVLAYEMNGAVLPREHGFPARLLVPDIYGMKNVKWVTRIEVVEYDYLGYWQERGWGDSAVMHTTSRIDFPKPRSALTPGANYVGGIALAGARGIRKVEVSTDGGRTWEPAIMKPPLGPYTWVLWLYEWTLPAGATAGSRVVVRATDGTGTVQIAELHDEIPDGATGLHAITVAASPPSEFQPP